MQQGTIKIKEALGSAISVSDAEIQESLWHYYFDVGKSVTYLKSMASPTHTSQPRAHEDIDKHTPKKSAAPSKTQKPVSRFDQAAGAASKSQTKSTTGEPTISYNPKQHKCAIFPSDSETGM